MLKASSSFTVSTMRELRISLTFSLNVTPFTRTFGSLEIRSTWVMILRATYRAISSLMYRVDAFGGVAEAEVAAVEPEVGGLFQDGKAVFFRAAGIGGGFIYDVVAFFQDFSYGAGGADEGLEVGYVVFVHGGRHSYDEETGFPKHFDVVGEDDVAAFQVPGLHFFAGINTGAHHFDAAGIDVESDDGNFPGEFQCDG